MSYQDTINRWRADNPGIKIRDTVRMGTERREIEGKPIDAKYAVPGDPCNCTAARAEKRVFRTPLARFDRTTTLVGEPLTGGWYQPTKYRHDGKWIADALDEHKLGAERWKLTLKPPSVPTKKKRKPTKKVVTVGGKRVAGEGARTAYRRRSLA